MAATPPPTTPRRWRIAPPPPPHVSDALVAYPPIVRQLLANRGIASAGEAETYLEPDSRLLGPPSLLPDMDRAVGRLYRALLAGERIAVYGDFDADGVTATALLVEALRSLGADPIAYIPHRVDEGHGINVEALTYLVAQGVSLVVTGDCGITGLTPTSRDAAIPRGLDVIITDHHLPGPDPIGVGIVAAVDPMRPDARYPWRELAGVGVVFKLVQALYAALGRPWSEDLLEFVALGTVADVATLTGENRYLVHAGLQRLRKTQRPGLRALARRAGYDLASLDEEAIAFGLGPRLNAAGRLAHADLSLDLLLARDEASAEPLAAQLEALNTRRQELTARIVQRAREAVLAGGGLEPLIMVGDPDFMPGIVGLAASRLAEEFYRPTLVFQHGPDEIRGSARSIPEFDVTDALTRSAALLTRFGGHHQAAGFTAPADHLGPLRAQLVALAGEMLAGADLRPSLLLDAEASPSSLTGPVTRLLQRMAPFGAGNPPPAFLARGLEVLSARPVGGDGSHLRLKLKERTTRVVWDAIAFRLGNRVEETISTPARREDLSRLDVAFRLRAGLPGESGPGRRRTLELEVLDFRRAEA